MSNQRTLAYALLFLASLMPPTVCRGQVITTVAGVNNQGYAGDGGPATSASLSNPEGLVVDSAGNIYFADKGNYAVREVNTGGRSTPWRVPDRWCLAPLSAMAARPPAPVSVGPALCL
jgi:hypothetical protein